MATKLTWTDPDTGVEYETGRKDVLVVPPEMVHLIKVLVDPARCDLDADEPLDASFIHSVAKTGGNAVPGIGRRDSAGTIWLGAGRRRLGATNAINAQPEIYGKAVPFQIRILNCTEEELLRLAFHENNNKPVSAIDLATSAAAFVDRCGWTQERAAEEMGVSAGQVSTLLRLLTLPPRVQKALHKGKIKTSFAQALYGHPIEKVDSAMDRFEGGELPRAILAEFRETKRREKQAKGESLALTLGEFKAILENSESNRATALLNGLNGKMSRKWDEILSDGAFDFRAAKVAAA